MHKSIHKALRRHFEKINPELKQWLHERRDKPGMFTDEWDEQIINKVKRICINILTRFKK